MARLLAGVVDVGEVELLVLGPLLHRLQPIGRVVVHVDRDNLHALFPVVVLQGDQAIFIGHRHGTVIAGEGHYNQLRLAVVGQSVLVVVDADYCRPVWCRVPDFHSLRGRRVAVARDQQHRHRHYRNRRSKFSCHGVVPS